METDPPIVDASRRSPFHELFAARGAVFDGTCGWSYPIWFRSDDPSSASALTGTNEDRSANRREQLLLRQNVGVFDCSALAHLLIIGPDSMVFLNELFTSNLDIKLGKVVHTHWCETDGTIFADVVISRHAHDRFLIALNDTSQRQVAARLADEIETGRSNCHVVDMSSGFATLIVAGPLARAALQPLTARSLAPEDFSPMTFQEIVLANAPVTVMRVSYVGEVCFELHIPTEYGWAVGNEVLRACEGLGGGAVGMNTVYALGSEFGMVDFDYNFDSTYTPFEIGVASTISWDKPGGFRGRAALAVQHRTGQPPQRLAFAHTHEHAAKLKAGAVVRRDGFPVGTVQTVDVGHTVNELIAVVRLAHADGVTPNWLSDGRWEIDTPTDRVAVAISTKGLYDPERRQSRS